MKISNVIVDIEAARGPTPATGLMTEFAAVDLATGKSFYRKLYDSTPHPDNPAIPVISDDAVEYPREQILREFSEWLSSLGGKIVFISDNPAYDFQWIAFYFDSVHLENPFGYSGRRIGDLYAGAMMGSGDVKGWTKTSNWKRLRDTKHTHHPLDDVNGNREALLKILEKFNQEF